MSNSSLVTYTRLSPNCNAPRKSKLLKITPHHMAGNLSLVNLGSIMANPSRQMSSNYGIDSAGNIGLFCEEKNRSWCSSSPLNDHQAITVEIANDGGPPNWHVSDRAIDALIRLSVDYCQRNGLSRVEYTGTADGSVTQHNMFTNTLCPGPYLQSRMREITNTVNSRLKSGGIIMSMSTEPVKMWFGPLSGGDQIRFINALNEKQIPFTTIDDKLLTSVKVSSGDQIFLMRLAIEIGNIGYGPICKSIILPGPTQVEYDTLMLENQNLKSRIKIGLVRAQETVKALTLI